MEILNDDEVGKIVYESSDAVFKFGDGNLLHSVKRAVIPCQLAGENIQIKTDLGNSDNPLLFSKQLMKKEGMKIDLINDNVVIFGKIIDLKTTSSGHYMLPIYRVPSE